MSRNLKAHLLLILATFIWGVTFVQIKDALRDISPLLFNAVRMVVATGAMLVVHLPHLRKMTSSTFWAGARVGIFLWLGYEFQTTGLKLTTPAKSAFLTGVSVVLVPVFLAIFWRKAVGRWNVVGVLAAFVGLFLLTVPGGAAGWGDFKSVNTGDLLTLVCAVAFAFHIIVLGRATKAHAFQQIAFLQIATAAVLMLPSVPVLEHAHVVWSWRVIIAILVTALFCTTAAFTIQSWSQQFVGATNTALILALEPVFAWLASYVVLGESLKLRAALGALLIIAGLLASELLGAVGEGQAAERELVS
ncbi:MAG TPA: DMT family transporter [Terriglobales bacterium]|jgi:drug/metabolite transporter (DMT)-like permease|nr:DMT family transporter [Terriglobales bacterium]